MRSRRRKRRRRSDDARLRIDLRDEPLVGLRKGSVPARGDVVRVPGRDRIEHVRPFVVRGKVCHRTMVNVEDVFLDHGLIPASRSVVRQNHRSVPLDPSARALVLMDTAEGMTKLVHDNPLVIHLAPEVTRVQIHRCCVLIVPFTQAVRAHHGPMTSIVIERHPDFRLAIGDNDHPQVCVVEPATSILLGHEALVWVAVEELDAKATVVPPEEGVLKGEVGDALLVRDGGERVHADGVRVVRGESRTMLY